MYKLEKEGMNAKKVLAIIALMLAAVLSVTVLSGYMSSTSTHAGTIQILEEQKNKALALGTTVTVASTALSVLPDDTATPIANQLADLSVPLFLIVAFLYMEIFLMTTFGWVSCTFLIPAVCVLAMVYILSGKRVFLIFVRKLSALSLALLLIIPCSAKVTEQVQNTYQEMIEQKYTAAQSLSSEADTAVDQEKNTDGNPISAFLSGVADTVSGTVDHAAGLIDAVKNNLSKMIDAVAVLVITSVIIPLLTFLLFLKIVKMVTDGSAPTEYVERALTPRFVRKKIKEKEQPHKQITA